MPAPLVSSPTPPPKAPPTQLMPGVVVADRYRVDALLGQGGMGIVYRCHDLTLGETVALKFLHSSVAGDPKMIRRFVDELKVVRQIQHKAVIHGYDLGVWKGLQFLVMQHVAGKPLNQVLAERGKLTHAEAVSIATQILGGLQAAHAEGVVHRDLKTDNILIDADGNAYILDFGIARRVRSLRTTMTGEVLGSPLYLSPEQAMGHDVDPRADLYSVGVLLFEMLTGDVPYNGFDALTVALKHVVEPVIAPSSLDASIPADLDAIVVRCLQKRPEHRHADAGHLVAELGRLEVTDARVPTAGNTPVPPVEQASTRNALRTTPPVARPRLLHSARSSTRLGGERFYHSHRHRVEEAS